MTQGDTFHDWAWILTRDEGGEWILRSFGAAP